MTKLRLFPCLALMLSASAASASQTVDVYVYDFDLSTNPDITAPAVDPVINVGDTIRWVWLHDFHSVVACVNQQDYWESDVFSTGATFVHTFDIPGVYQYYCAPHGRDLFDGTYEGMGGSVTVVVPAPPACGLLACSALLACRRARRR